MSELYILTRFNSRKEVSYVEYVKPLRKQNPVTTGNDWGYTSDPAKAIKVSAYHKRRFLNDAAYCGFAANARLV